MQMAQKYDILYVNFYTDGSAARKVTPAVSQESPRRKAAPKRQQKRVIYLDPVAVCSIMVAAVLLVFMAVGLSRYQTVRAEAQAMEAYVEQLSAEKQELTQTFYDNVDLESVERTALTLGMIPADQAKTVQVAADPVQEIRIEENSPSVWDQFLSFLTNLFA